MLITSAQMVALLMGHSYLILFLLMLVEGPIVTIVGAFVASLGYMNVFAVLGLSILDDFVTDAWCYFIGHHVRARIIEKYGHYFGFTKKRLIALERHFKNHPRKTLVTAKLTPGPGALALMAAGGAGMPFFDFMFINTVVTVLKSPIFVIIGFYFGKAYQVYDQWLGYAAIAATVIALGLLIRYLHNRGSGKERED